MASRTNNPKDTLDDGDQSVEHTVVEHGVDDGKEDMSHEDHEDHDANGLSIDDGLVVTGESMRYAESIESTPDKVDGTDLLLKDDLADLKIPEMPAKRRRKVASDRNAPKPPLSGYQRFLVRARPALSAKHPEMAVADQIKQLGYIWSSLPQEEKQKYIDDAEEDKKRYAEEITKYQSSDHYRDYIDLKRHLGGGSSFFDDDDEDGDSGLSCTVCKLVFTSAHNKRAHVSGKRHQELVSAHAKKRKFHETVETDDAAPGFQVFTQQFLQYNKSRDDELRTLSKTCSLLEEQNGLLQKGMEQLKKTVSVLKADSRKMAAQNEAIRSMLANLRFTLTSLVAHVPPSAVPPSVNPESVEAFVARLRWIIARSEGNEAFFERVRDLIGGVDLRALDT